MTSKEKFSQGLNEYRKTAKKDSSMTSREKFTQGLNQYRQVRANTEFVENNTQNINVHDIAKQMYNTKKADTFQPSLPIQSQTSNNMQDFRNQDALKMAAYEAAKRTQENNSKMEQFNKNAFDVSKNKPSFMPQEAPKPKGWERAGMLAKDAFTGIGQGLGELYTGITDIAVSPINVAKGVYDMARGEEYKPLISTQKWREFNKRELGLPEGAETDRQIAKGAGKLVADVAQVIGTGGVVRAAGVGSTVTNPISQKMLQSGVTGGASSILSSASDQVDLPTAAKNLARDTMFYAAGGAASGKVNEVAKQLMVKYGLQNKVAYELARNAVNGIAFDIGGYATTMPTYEGLGDRKPTAEEIGTDMAIGFLFEFVPGAYSTLKTTKANKVTMQNTLDVLKTEYELASQVESSNKNNPEVLNNLYDSMLRKIGTARQTLNDTRILGEDKAVKDINTLFDATEREIAIKKARINSTDTRTSAAETQTSQPVVQPVTRINTAESTAPIVADNTTQKIDTTQSKIEPITSNIENTTAKYEQDNPKIEIENKVVQQAESQIETKQEIAPKKISELKYRTVDDNGTFKGEIKANDVVEFLDKQDLKVGDIYIIPNGGAGHVLEVADISADNNYAFKHHTGIQGREKYNNVLKIAEEQQKVRESTNLVEQPKNWLDTVSENDLDYETMRRSYTWNTMDPEKHAKSDIKSYVATMKNFYEKLEPLAKTDAQKLILNEQLTAYKEGYLKKYNALVSARSRTASPMVTGPAKFPTAKNQKALEVEQKRRTEYLDYVKNSEKRIIKALEGAKTGDQVKGEEVARLEKEVKSTAATLKGIKNGTMKGYNPALFRSNLADKIKRSANNGHIEAVENAMKVVKQFQEDTGIVVFAKNNAMWNVVENAKANIAAKEAKIQARQEVALNNGGIPSHKIEKTKHTKTGADMWVMKLDDRLEPTEFKELEKKMKDLGAYYSRFAGGFVFNSEPNIKANNNAIATTETKAEIIPSIESLKLDGKTMNDSKALGAAITELEAKKGLLPLDLQMFADKMIRQYKSLYKQLRAEGISEETIDRVKKIKRELGVAERRLEREKAKLATRAEGKAETVKNRYEKKIDKVVGNGKNREAKLQAKIETMQQKAYIDKNVTKEVEKFKKMEAENKATIKKNLKRINAIDTRKLNPEVKEQIENLKRFMDGKVVDTVSEFDVEKLKTALKNFGVDAENPEGNLTTKGMANRLEKLIKVNDKDLSYEEFDDIYKSVMMLYSENRNMNKFLSSQRYATINEGVNTIENDITKNNGTNRGRKLGNNGELTKLSKNNLDKVELHMLSPKALIAKLEGAKGGALREYLYTNMVKGHSKKYGYLQRSFAYFQDNLKDVDFKTIEKATYDIETETGKLTISSMEKVAIALNTFNDKNKYSLLNGGISRVNETDKVYKISESTVNSVVNALTQDERKIVDVILNYYDTLNKDAINEVTMALWNYEGAGEKGYYPKKVNPDKVRVSESATLEELSSLQHMNAGNMEGAGFLKAKTNTKTPIYLLNPIDVVVRMMYDTADLTAYAVPLRDARLILRKTRSFITNNYSNTMYQQLQGYVNDMNSPTFRNPDIDKMLGKVYRNVVRSVFGFNISTSLKQPLGLLNAMGEIEPKYIVQATAKKLPFTIAKEEMDRMYKFAPYLWHRANGNFNREMSDKGLNDKINLAIYNRKNILDLPTAHIGMTDMYVAHRIWTASEIKVKAETNLKAGTDEYYQAIGDMATEVTLSSQGSGELTHRSELLRSENIWKKGLTAFQSQNAITLNQLVMSYEEFKDNKNIGKFINKLIILGVAPILASLLVGEGVREWFGNKNSLTVRYKKAMKTGNTAELEKIKLAIFDRVVADTLMLVPYAGLTYDVVTSSAFSSNSSNPLFRELITLGQTVGKLIDTNNIDSEEVMGSGPNAGLNKKKVEADRAYLKIADSLANLSGIPKRNVGNIANGLLNTVGLKEESMQDQYDYFKKMEPEYFKGYDATISKLNKSIKFLRQTDKSNEGKNKVKELQKKVEELQKKAIEQYERKNNN